MEEKHTVLKKKKLEIAVGLLAVAVVVLGVCAGLKFTAPYAVTADGEKIEDPWVVTIGEDEAYVVASEEDGKKIIKGVKEAYATEGSEIIKADLEPQMKVVEKDLERGTEPLSITETEDAVNEIVTANATAEPMVVVTLTEKVSTEQEIEFETTYEKSPLLYMGEEKILEKGEKGQQTVVTEVTKTNGQVVSSTVVSTVVNVEAKNQVVQTGTKRMTSSVASDVVNKGGVAMGVGSGSEVANYALQFVGNPYKYGGTSLTNGADCSGFVMSVYAHFGISLPRTSGGQAAVGKAVSYSEARPGDIICYSGHVGIYIGGGKIVHASTPSTGIIVSNATYRTIKSVRRIVE
ncbi:MAG: C40 family peptidase [Firmicutes bacterium]|nr:C40 family peptidase [Bacillota bacterium]